MTKTFTPNDVVRFLYQETPDKDKQWISSIITTDEEYNRLYRELLLAKELVDQLAMEPSDESVETILAFSRNYTACSV